MAKQDIIEMLERRVKTLEKSRYHIESDPTDYAQYALNCAIQEIKAGGYPYISEEISDS